MRESTYRFAPHPSNGFLLGLRVGQLAGFVVAGVFAISLLHRGGLTGLALALACFAVAAGVLLVPVRGHTIEQWTPLTVSFLLRRVSGRNRFRASRAQLGHLVRLPDGGLDPQPPQAPWALPAELADVELLEGALARYDGARFGVVKDRAAGTFTAAVVEERLVRSAAVTSDPASEEAARRTGLLADAIEAKVREQSGVIANTMLAAAADDAEEAEAAE